MPQTFGIDCHVRVTRGFHRVNNFVTPRQCSWKHCLSDFNARMVVVMTYAQIIEAHASQTGFGAVNLPEDGWRNLDAVFNTTGKARHLRLVPIAETDVTRERTHIV